MAHAMPSVLPSMTIEEALEVTKIYSVSGLLPPETPLIPHLADVCQGLLWYTGCR